jgi:phage major head subunit gpT-like protein
MEITPQVLRALNTGFNSIFQESFKTVKPVHPQIAMRTNSLTEKEVYGWLKMTKGMRKWVGDRYIHNAESDGYTLVNDSFEKTIGIKREAIDDNTVGLYKPLLSMLGEDAAKHPDQLVFSVLKAGTTSICFDGKPFFSSDHDGQSNFDDGSFTPWYLMDTSRVVKPFIFQMRKEPEFVYLDNAQDASVFMRREYLYGVDGRWAAGYGLWQLAFCSKEPLTPANFGIAYAAMMSMKGEDGVSLDIIPNLLVVPPSLMEAGRKILKADLTVDSGNVVTNIWTNTTELLVAPLLA